MNEPAAGAPFTEPTTGYWQRLLRTDDVPSFAPPWRHGYPARLPDGSVLVLPIRALAANPAHAVASLIANQASLAVVDALGALLATQIGAAHAAEPPEAIVGLPTLGLAFAPLVARALGHTRYLPLGYSRKFWYDEALSVPVQSITSPTPGKRLYLDPNLLPLLRGRRVVIVDDAVSTGTTLAAAWTLLETLGARVLGAGVAMRQGRRWVDTLEASGAGRAQKVCGVFDSPLLQASAQGWVLRD